MQNEKPRDKIIIDAKTLAAIEAALEAKQRIELVRTADGVKIYNVKRKELNILP